METDISGDGLSCVLSVSMKGSLLYSNLSHILISPRDPTNWDVTWWWRHHTPPISRASKNFMETNLAGDWFSCVLSDTMLWSLLHWNLSHILIPPPSHPRPKYYQVVTSRYLSHLSCTQNFYGNQLSWWWAFLCTINCHDIITVSLKFEPHLKLPPDPTNLDMAR